MWALGCGLWGLHRQMRHDSRLESFHKLTILVTFLFAVTKCPMRSKRREVYLVSWFERAQPTMVGKA